MKYSKVDSFIKTNKDKLPDVEITRRIFISYIQKGLLPDVKDENKPNNNITYYTKDQIICYLMAQQLKSTSSLEDLSKLFTHIREFEFLFGSGEELFKEFIEFQVQAKEALTGMLGETMKLMMKNMSKYTEDDEEKEWITEYLQLMMSFITLITGRAYIESFKAQIEAFSFTDDKE